MNNAASVPVSTPTDPPHAVADFAARLDSIIAPLLLLIAAWFRILGCFTVPLWTRVSRARVRLARILANLAAGRLPRPRTPRPGRKGGPPAPYSPRGNLWLVRKLGYHAAGYGSQLNHLLLDPATQALLANAPPAALGAIGRTLRPLCTLLGVPLPEPLRPAPRPPRTRPRRTRPERPPSKRALRAAIPAHQPVLPQRRPRPLPFLRFPAKKSGDA